MNAETDASAQSPRPVAGGRDSRVSWLDVACAWAALLAVGVVGLML